MTPSDIVSAAIAVGVRVERTVEIPGGDDVSLAVMRAGGTRTGSEVAYTGIDSDGVEWSILVRPVPGIGVYAPSTPGAPLTEQARFARLDDAREYAALIRRRRRDLTAMDIRIGEPVIEYAGATR